MAQLPAVVARYNVSWQECDAATCPCGKLCANRELSTQEAPPVALFLTETKGWGVKATRRISRGGWTPDREVLMSLACV